LAVPKTGPTYNNHHNVRVDYFVRVGMYEDYGSEIHLDLPVVIGTIGTEGNFPHQHKADNFHGLIIFLCPDSFRSLFNNPTKDKAIITKIFDN